MQEEYSEHKGNESEKAPGQSDSSPASLYPKQYQHAKRGESRNHTENTEDEAERLFRNLKRWFWVRFFQAKLVDIAGIVTGIVLVVVGIIAACIYDGQLQAMRHTNELTEAALRLANQNSTDSSNQFQAQLRHYDAGLGRTELLARHAGEQADAANRIARITAKQFDQSQRLIESQRASIDVSFLRVLNPVTFSELGGMSEAFSIALKNNGTYPANLTSVRYKVIFVQWGDDLFKTPQSKQAELCDKSPTADELFGVNTPTTIYKEPALEWQINFGTGKPTDSEVIKWPPGDSVQILRIYPMVVGCVDYQSGAMKNSHQTGFIFTIERSGENGTNLPTLIDLGVNVPRENVIINKYFFSQGKSY